MAEVEHVQGDKLAELILHVAKKLEGDPAGGATKLNKVLFFAEFTHVRTCGAPITGEPYQRLPQGPAPRHLLPIRDRLLGDGSAELREDKYFGRTLHRLVARREPDLSGFSESELQTVEQVVTALWSKPASEVSRLSHEEIGWQIVEDGEDIPFATAFLDSREAVTDTSRRHAKELAVRLGLTG